jgi:hypothetical protein
VDPDPHPNLDHFDYLDPDPNPHPDPHQGDKSNPDPHQRDADPQHCPEHWYKMCAVADKK